MSKRRTHADEPVRPLVRRRIHPRSALSRLGFVALVLSPIPFGCADDNDGEPAPPPPSTDEIRYELQPWTRELDAEALAALTSASFAAYHRSTAMKPHDPSAYFEQDNWCGTHFGVLIDLGPRDDGRLMAAFHAVFGHAQLHGPPVDPYGGPTAGIDHSLLEPMSSAFGEILLEGRWVGRTVSATRYLPEECLRISIATGMLDTIIEMPYPTSTTKPLARVETVQIGS